MITTKRAKRRQMGRWAGKYMAERAGGPMGSEILGICSPADLPTCLPPASASW